MSARITARTVKELVEIKVWLNHVSESGLRPDAKTNRPVPADYVQHIAIKADDRVLIEANLGGDLSHNPEFTFKAKALKPGAKISIEWIDNQGKKGSAETKLSA